MTVHASPDIVIAYRQRLMAACTAAKTAELLDALADFGPLPPYRDLRVPECGLVMLRGRIGGDGAPFNVGEATVVRAAVVLGSGEVGHAYQLGSDTEKARVSALFDAIAQKPDSRHRLTDLVIRPIEERIEEQRTVNREQVAATRVDFFTMVRGED